MPEDIDNLTDVCAQLYARAALDLGIEVRALDRHSLITCRKNGKAWNILGARVPINDSVAFSIARSKLVAIQLLRNEGLPVPEGYAFGTLRDALPFFWSRPFSVVVKPNQGIGGRGVTLKPETDREFAAAFKSAAAHDDVVLVEQFIAGKNYRVLVLDGRVIAASERIPACVVGNGRHTIAELISEANCERRADPTLDVIPVDVEAQQCLHAQGLCLATIPAGGVTIYVRRNANLTTGGITVDCTDEVHPETAAAAIAATRTLGLKLAGVDIITESIAESIHANGGVINEVNANPGLRVHYCVSRGMVRNVGTMIQQYILDH